MALYTAAWALSSLRRYMPASCCLRHVHLISMMLRYSSWLKMEGGTENQYTLRKTVEKKHPP